MVTFCWPPKAVPNRPPRREREKEEESHRRVYSVDMGKRRVYYVGLIRGGESIPPTVLEATYFCGKGRKEGFPCSLFL